MGINWKSKGAASSIPWALAISAIVNIVITLTGGAITAYLLLTERIGENGIRYASMIILLISAIMGAWSAYSCIKKQRLQICMMSAGVYYLLLMAITALFFGGQYQSMGITAVIILVGTVLVAILTGKDSGKIRFKKRAYR